MEPLYADLKAYARTIPNGEWAWHRLQGAVSMPRARILGRTHIGASQCTYPVDWTPRTLRELWTESASSYIDVARLEQGLGTRGKARVAAMEALIAFVLDWMSASDTCCTAGVRTMHTTNVCSVRGA